MSKDTNVSNPIPPPKKEVQKEIVDNPKFFTAFKSSSNVLKEQMNQQVILSNHVSFKMAPNVSILIKVDYGHQYKTEPMVFYTVSCNDLEFGLNHYVYRHSCNECTVAIENQSGESREVSLYYKVSPN